MSGRLLRLVRMPLPDLLLSMVRMGGTRIFVLTVLAARALRILPQANRPGSGGESILVVALTPHLGDAVMLMPMLQALKAAHPATPVDLAIERSAAPLFDHMSELRVVYPLSLGNVPPEGTRASIARIYAITRAYWSQMRGCRPAICIIPRWGDDLFRSIYLSVLTGAPRRIGFASKAGWPFYRFAPYRDRLLTDAIMGAGGLHEPMRFMYLLHRAGLLNHEPDNKVSFENLKPMLQLAQSVDWRQLSSRLNLPSKPYAVIAPGASQAKKIWPVDAWCEVITGLKHMGLHTVLLSGKSDAEIAEGLHERCGTMTTLVSGVTNFAESAALLKQAAVFLGSDSGPAHVAGPLGTAAIVLFVASESAGIDDPFSPLRNRPIGPRVAVCSPCVTEPPCVDTCHADEPHCILRITPAEVLRQVEHHIAEGVPAS